MFWNKTNMDINIISKINVSDKFWCNEAVLIEVVNGKASLTTKSKSREDSYYGQVYDSVFCLNDLPLVQCNSPGCPTCASMLSTGYGIERITCEEISSIIEKVNDDYSDLYTAVNNIKPILGLLESGVYIIADTMLYPTDGNDNFFWNVKNKMTEYPATSIILTEEHDCVGGIPAYTFPTQSTDCFNEERVLYYKEKYDNINKYPRALAYYYSEFISILLDGHHKATAAALLGKPFPCIAIMHVNAFSYKEKSEEIDEVYFGGIKLKSYELSKEHLSNIKKHFKMPKKQSDVKFVDYELIKHNWSDEYLNTYKKFPNVYEFAESIALQIDEISDEIIAHSLNDINEEKAKILSYIITVLSRKNDSRVKELALKCAKINHFPKLKKVSYIALSKIKNDIEIEQFFIEHLIDDNDPHSALRNIADSYFE